MVDWVKSPFSVFTGSPAVAWDTPGAAGFDPPITDPDGTSPPVDGARAAVAELTGAPASTYACPVAPSDAVNPAGEAALSNPTGVSPAGHALIVSSTEHAGAGHDPTALLASPLNAASPSAAHVFTVPESGHDDPCPVTVNPPPSTLASNGTAVSAAAVAYSQFSDTYNPVPLPATAYPIASDSKLAPALPASAGAVPSTATLPVTAGPHVPAVDSASDGTLEAHVPLDGSPMISAEYALNCAVVIASQVDGDATVTVYPAGTAFASALDEPPFTLVDKISADPDPAAHAGLAAATAATAAPVTPAVTTDTGTSPHPTPVTGAITAATRPRHLPLPRPLA
ncbi:MAG TPA: hypothetical protein VNF47_24720 [Streptosporangiaceae bacterium]|nr:hypothetical protein [Streptosporangiaceae bacterium]